MLSWLRRRANRRAPTQTAAAPAQTTPATAGAPAGSAAPADAATAPAEAAGAQVEAAGAQAEAAPAAEAESTGVPAAPAVLPGVDVSSWQGLPAAWRPQAGTIAWAAVKVTEFQPGGVRYVNPDASADWAFLGQQNLGRIAYLFGHPSVSAADTVSFFISELHSLGLNDPDGVMLDLEVTDGLAPAQVNAWAAQVMAALAAQLHRAPLLYTFESFAQAGNTASLGGYPLWISDPSSQPGQPQVPLPWHKWTIHQYSISGPIDRDVANFANLAAMTKALGKAEGPQMQNLGGSISGDVVAVRWDNGITVVAGLGVDGLVQIKRFHPADNTWGPWRDISPTKALGAPGMISWGPGHGRLLYANESGEVIELATDDSGATWS